jgi:hypothetical protein
MGTDDWLGDHDARCGAIEIALAELGVAPEKVSRDLGLAPGYLGTFLATGCSAGLPGQLRRRLAAYLGVPDHALR